jgi:hypothetical protein
MSITTCLFQDTVIHIDNYTNDMKGNIFCKGCNSIVIAKKGTIKIHHFAHKDKICDLWKTTPMTEWHRNWQKLCKPEFLEVRIEKNNVFHIADIKTPNDLVIEIQHSNLSYTDVKNRESFYDNMIWIIDGSICNIIFSGSFIAPFNNKLPFIAFKVPAFLTFMCKPVFIDIGDNYLYRSEFVFDHTFNKNKSNYIFAIGCLKNTVIHAMFGNSLQSMILDSHVTRSSDNVIMTFVDNDILSFSGSTYLYKDLFRNLKFNFKYTSKSWDFWCPLWLSSWIISNKSFHSVITAFNTKIDQICLLCNNDHDSDFDRYQSLELYEDHEYYDRLPVYSCSNDTKIYISMHHDHFSLCCNHRLSFDSYFHILFQDGEDLLFKISGSWS